jgi:sulfate adenylyltransferase (ADP) / ATP adenylyltransferase
LKKKPHGDGNSHNNISASGPKSSTFDPFADPSQELLVASVPNGKASHNLILNKYPVIHNHLIIATTENKPQTDVLEADDLTLTLACLRAWQDYHGRNPASQLFAFFNSGEHSGASQAHRHLQFLPVQNMMGGAQDDWILLVNRMNVRAHPSLPLFQDPDLPILHFSTPLEHGISAQNLHSKYLLLLRAALSASQAPNKPLDEGEPVARQGKALLSYNLAMTTDRMAICPRRQEAVAVPKVADSSVAINGTLLAGTLMVKDEEEWDILRSQPLLLDGMIADLGFPMFSWSRSTPGNKI